MKILTKFPLKKSTSKNIYMNKNITLTNKKAIL